MRWLLIFLFCGSVGAEIIPATNRVTWTGNVGVQGGVPHRTTIHETLTEIDDTGSSDVRAAIQSSIDAAAAISNRVVELPEGTFRINAALVMKTGVTLRGQGTNTIISYHGSNGKVIQFGDENTGVSMDERAISGSPAKGDTTITVASTTAKFVAGNLMLIDQLNHTDGLLVVTKEGTQGQQCTFCSRDSGDRSLMQIVLITGVSGNDITFTPPLYWKLSSGNSPEALAYAPMIQWAGVEDLKIYSNGTAVGQGCNFPMFGYINCWVKNVESDYCDGDHVTLRRGLFAEIRDSYFHNGYTHAPGSVESSVALQQGASANLIENNIIRRAHVSINLTGASGNVIGYNYTTNGFSSGAVNAASFGAIIFHGAHALMNLFEGNVGTIFNQDAVWGSSSHNTVFRNFFSGETWHNPPYTGRGDEDLDNLHHGFQNAQAIHLGFSTRYFNIVGNVLGSRDLDDNFVRGYTVGSQVVGSFPADYMWKYPETGRPFDENGTVFAIGYDGLTEDGSEDVFDTTLIHGNWDVADKEVKWDAGIADHDLPDSLYLTSEPSWMLAYPPIDPETYTNGQSLTNQAAVYRYFHGEAVGGGEGSGAATVGVVELRIGTIEVAP